MPITIDIGELGPINVDSFSFDVQYAGAAGATAPTTSIPTDCRFSRATDEDSSTLVQYAATGKRLDVVTVTFYKSSAGGGFSQPYLVYYLHGVTVTSWRSDGREDTVGLNFESLEIPTSVYDDPS